MGGRSRIIELGSLEKTLLFGRHAGKILPAGSVLALQGPLGAGKTSFVQGLGQGLGVAAPIQSPTFTYLHLYEEGRLPLFHFDLYRMKTADDFFAMGFEELLNRGGITAIEWPERLGPALPPRAISLRFSYSGPCRNVDLSSAFDPDLVNWLTLWD